MGSAKPVGTREEPRRAASAVRAGHAGGGARPLVRVFGRYQEREGKARVGRGTSVRGAPGPQPHLVASGRYAHGVCGLWRQRNGEVLNLRYPIVGIFHFRPLLCSPCTVCPWPTFQLIVILYLMK